MTPASPSFPVAHEFHMSLRVADLAASTVFYTSFLGTAPKDTTARYSTFTVPHLHLNLVLLVNDSAQPLDAHSLYHLGLGVADKKFELRGVEVRVHGVRQDVPPRMESVRYEIVVDTDESDQRLNLLHDNVKKYGTVFNTVSPGTDLAGTMRRKLAPVAGQTL